MKDGMIVVNHGGWSEDRGWFSDDFVIDTKKTDYEIHFPDGEIYKQNTPFESRTMDWNYDGDVYEKFGAFFYIEMFGRSEFFSPEEMISLCVHHGCKIPGLMTKEEMNRKASLADKISEIQKSKIKNDERNKEKPVDIKR